MPLIDTTTFLKLADRMAANYEILLAWEVSVNVAATASTVTIDPFGDDNNLIYTAKTAGSDGNSITIEYVDPGSALSALAVTVTGTAISVSMETDAGSAIVSTADEVLAAIVASNAADLLVSVANSGLGTGITNAVPQTSLAGGLHGFTNPVVLDTEDADVVANINAAAGDFDSFMTASLAVKGMSIWDSLIIAVNAHFSAVGQAGLTDGFLTDSDIRVHENFNTLYNITNGTFLSGANVFQKTVINVAVIDLTDGAGATATLNPVGSTSLITIDPTGDGLDNAVDYAAVVAGEAGDSVNITYLDPAAPSALLIIEVQGQDIIVHLATDIGSAITTTAGDIDTAITAHTAASALVTTSLPGTGAAVVTAIAQTFLTNRNTSITYSAVDSGSDGNEISIEYTDPGGPTSGLLTTVSGSRITVSLETDGASAIISTAAEVEIDVDGTAAAAALVATVANDDNLGIVSPVSRTFLQGGSNAAISESNPLGVGTGLATDDNFAAQWLEVCPQPANKFASLEVYPSTATAFLIVPLGATEELRLDAFVAGTSGNLVTFEVIYDQSASVAESVAVVSNAVTVTLATNAASVITSTVASIVGTIAGSGAAAALMVGTVETAGTVECAFPTTNLDNTRTRVLYTADTAGEAGNTITIEYIDPAGPAVGESVAVTGGTAIAVTLSTDGASAITSTPTTIIATVNGDVTAAALVTAAPVSETDGIVDAFAATNLAGGAGPSLRRATTLELTLLKSDLTTVIREVTVSPAGFNLRLTDPSLSSGTGEKVAVSPDGRHVAVAITASPYIQVLPFDSATGNFDMPVADPSVLPTGAGHGVAWSPDGSFVAIAHTTTPFISAYEWTGDAFGAKIANPSTLPTGVGNDIKWNVAGTYVAVAHAVSPFVSVYPWTGVFGAKVANPGTLPTGIGNAVDWAPDDTFAAVAHDTSPYVSVYPWTGGFGTKIANPATLPTGHGKDVVFNAAGDNIAVAHTTTPFVSVYDFAGTFGIKFSDPSTLPAGNGLSVGYTPGGAYIAVGFTGSEYLHLYPWSDKFGDVIVTTDVPGNTGGVAFHPTGTYLFAGVVNGSGSTLIGYQFNEDECQPIAAEASTLLLTSSGTNNLVLFTAVTAGIAGDSITVVFTDPGTPCAALGCTVLVNAITVTLATDFDGRVISTADEVIAIVNGTPAAAALVTASNSGLGHEYVSTVSGTLSGGFDRERFFEVTAVDILVGGEAEDQYLVKQVIERTITL